MSNSAISIAGNPPVASGNKITLRPLREWIQKLIDARLTYCPLERATTHYFSAQSGDDVTGDGTEALPWATLAKAQEVLTASSGNIRLRFLRGDEWYQTNGITVNKSNVTIDAYGVGAAPIFCRFTVLYPNATSWTLESGNVYYREESNDIAYLRERQDIRNPYYLANSIASCEARPGSFWYDPIAARLYVHRRDSGNINNDGRNYEAVISNTTPGISPTVSANLDSIRIDGIRVDGYGMHRTNEHNPGYCIKLSQSGQNVGCVTNCEAYYSTTHVMGHADTNSGGISLWLGNRMGWCTPSTVHSPLILVGYATNGGHEFISAGNTFISGQLPYTFGDSTARAVGSHAGGSAIASLLVSIDDVVIGGDFQATQPPGLGSAPSASIANLNNFRAFVIGAKFDTRKSQSSFRTGAQICQTNVLTANCSYRWAYAGTLLSPGNASSNNGVSVNVDIIFNLSKFLPESLQRVALVNPSSSSHNNGYLINCRIRAEGLAPTNNAVFGVDYSRLLATSTNFVAINTILEADKLTARGRFFPGLENTADNMINCAFSDIQPSFSNAANPVIFSGLSPDNAGLPDLQGKGSTVYTADSDINGKRRPAIPTIGPYEAYSETASDINVDLIGVAMESKQDEILAAIAAVATLAKQEEILGAIGDEATVNVLPAVGISADRSPGVTLKAFVGETITQSITLYETNGTTPIVLTGKTLVLVFETRQGLDVATVASGDITIGGTSDNVVTFAYPAAATASERVLKFALRDAGSPNTVYLQGLLSVQRAPKVD
jgi:hypothetical protein